LELRESTGECVSGPGFILVHLKQYVSSWLRVESLGKKKKKKKNKTKKKEQVRVKNI